MSAYEVIGYTSDRLADVKQLWAGWLKEFGLAESALAERETFFRWLTERNPFLDGRFPYYLFLHEDRVIGMHGHMPLRISVNGKALPGLLAHDDLISVECRGKGVGTIMVESVTKRVSAFAGSLWHNEPNRRVYLKAGWLQVPDLFPYVRVFDPSVFLRTRLGDGILTRMASPAVRAALELRNLPFSWRALPQHELERLERFDERFDAFFDNIADRLGVGVIRKAAYLNWKFVEKPFNAYTRRAILDSAGELAGYSVSKTAVEEGTALGVIVDILADPRQPDMFSGLVKQCLEDFADQGVSYARILCTHPMFAAPLRRLGFLRARRPANFLIVNWEGVFEREFIGSIGNWYLTYSDADGDAWTVDSRESDPREGL